MIDLAAQDVRDLVEGAAILGTGGGGDPKKGAEILLEDLEYRHRLRLARIEELENKEGLVIVPYLVGSIAQTRSQQERVSDLITAAIRTFEEEFRQPIIGTVATEVGGLNSAMALHAAAYVDLPAVDADVVGRAAPEACHSVLNLAGVSLFPAVVVGSPNEKLILREEMSSADYETALRSMSAKSGGYIAVVDSPCRPGAVKNILVRGSMTRSMALGRARREALQRGKDPVRAIEHQLPGKLVFSGTISDVGTKDAAGFLKGKVTVVGEGEWKDHTFESMIINEHILGRRQGSPLVMPPDCFAFLDLEGHAIMNNDLRAGSEVRIVAWEAPSQWRTAKGLALFGPRHFGLDFDYVPLEQTIRM